MFGWINILQRWLFVNLIVFASYNPSGFSFYDWFLAPTSDKSIVAVVGVILFSIYVFLCRSTWRSIKLSGILIAATFFFLFNVMLIDVGLVAEPRGNVIELMILGSIAGILTVGLCFSAVRARLSGQIDSDDVGTPS